MGLFRRSLTDPAPDARWEVWYDDTFDHEAPQTMDTSGSGLMKGLMELWARYLFETVQPEGMRGFSRFSLRRPPERSVFIVGPWSGAVRLRSWVFGQKKHTRRGYISAGDKRLLEKIAWTHAKLLLAGGSSETMMTAAAEARDQHDFEKRLAELVTP